QQSLRAKPVSDHTRAWRCSRHSTVDLFGKLLIRARHYLYDETACSCYMTRRVNEYTKAHGRWNLFRHRQIVGQVLTYLPRDNWNRAIIGLAVKTYLKSSIANHIEHARTDHSPNVQFSLLVDQKIDLGVANIASHITMRIRFGRYVADWPLTLKLHRDLL